LVFQLYTCVVIPVIGISARNLCSVPSDMYLR
jgi:hypothetical protein